MRRGPLILAGAGAMLAAPAAAQQAVRRTGLSDPASLSRTLEREIDGTVRSPPSLDLPDATSDLRPVPTDPALGVAVGARSRRDFGTDPVPLGALLLSARGTATAGYDGNVYRLRDGPGDAYGTAHLNTRLRTNSPRHMLELRATATEIAYAKYDTDNAFTYDLGASGRLDLDTNDRLMLDVARSRQLNERSSGTEILATRRPVRYDLTTVGGSAQKVWGRLGINLSALAARYDFKDAETPDGQPLDSDFRDNRTWRARADVSYALGPGPVVYATIQAQLVRFDQTILAGINRDSNQYTATAGIRGEITPLLRGQLGVGYLYARTRIDQNRSGPTVEASLQYLVTELTTITLSANRAFQNVGSVTTPLTLNTQLRAQADHELRRNVILTASATYNTNSYADGSGGAKRLELRTGGDWLLGRRLRTNLRLGYRRLDGSGRLGNRRFDQAMASAGVSFQL